MYIVIPFTLKFPSKLLILDHFPSMLTGRETSCLEGFPDAPKDNEALLVDHHAAIRPRTWRNTPVRHLLPDQLLKVEAVQVIAVVFVVEATEDVEMVSDDA